MAPDYTNELVPVNRFLQKSSIHETLLAHSTGSNNDRIYIPAYTGLQVTACLPKMDICFGIKHAVKNTESTMPEQDGTKRSLLSCLVRERFSPRKY